MSGVGAASRVAVSDPAGERRHQRGRRWPRRHQQPRRHGRHTDHILKIKWQRDEGEALSDKAQDRGRNREREDRSAKEVDRQQRHRLVRLAPQQKISRDDSTAELADNGDHGLVVAGPSQ
jgi:hypothetical protein